MPAPIRILLDGKALRGELRDGPTARAVLAALPFEAPLRSFGDSFYAESPVDVALEPGSSDRVAVGDIAYWPPALAVALYFGPTPESRPGDATPVAASEVTVIGRVEDPAALAAARGARMLRLERA